MTDSNLVHAPGDVATIPVTEQSGMTDRSEATEPLYVIGASSGWSALDLRALWRYRELLYFLVWRDVKVRYKQTILGAGWAVLQPVLTMVVFSIFFGELADVPSDGVPYPVFTFAALLPWQLFAHALAQSGNSLVVNQELVTKVYFPRLLMPISAVVGGLVDFGISFVVLLGMMYFYGITPTVAVLTLPALVALACLTALAVGIWFSALNVKYRDVRYTITFLTQFWLFATPIAYPISIVPEKWRVVYALNPMVGVVEGFRWALLGKTEALDASMLVSILVVALLLVGGLIYFKRTERTLADVI